MRPRGDSSTRGPYLEIDVEIVYDLLHGDSLAFRDFANAIDAWMKGV